MSNQRKRKRKNRIVEKEGFESRVERAYGIVESSLKESYIVEHNKEIENKEYGNNDAHNPKSKTKIYIVKSKRDKDTFYEVNMENKTCTCSDFIFRHVKCKHIIATEFVLP